MITIKPEVARKLRGYPKQVTKKLQGWVDSVEKEGIEKTRRIPGYRDKALSGARKGQRSIRLNRAYRAFYTINNDGELDIIDIIEVNKHAY